MKVPVQHPLTLSVGGPSFLLSRGGTYNVTSSDSMSRVMSIPLGSRERSSSLLPAFMSTREEEGVPCNNPDFSTSPEASLTLWGRRSYLSLLGLPSHHLFRMGLGAFVQLLKMTAEFSNLVFDGM